MIRSKLIPLEHILGECEKKFAIHTLMKNDCHKKGTCGFFNFTRVEGPISNNRYRDLNLVLNKRIYDF